MKRHLPEYMQKPLAAKGVNTDGIIYAIHTDMTKDGAYADVYIAIDALNLYILYGTEQIVKTQGARRIVAEFAEKAFETHKLDSFTELKTERMLSTGRLYACSEAGDDLLLVFSVGHLAYAERLCKAVKNIKDGVDALQEIKADESLFCPKCGTRFPEPERGLCLKCMDKVSITRRLLSFFTHYKRKVLIVMAVMFLGTAFQILSPYVSTKLFFDEVLTEGGRYFEAIGMMVLVIFAVRAIGVGLNILYSVVLAKTVPWIVYDLKVRIFEAMQNLSVGFYTSKRTGALMNRVNTDATNIYWFFVDGLPYVIVNVLLFAGVITLMCLLNLKLALISIAAVPLAVVLFRILWRLFHKFHHKNWVYNSQLNSMVSDSLNGQRVIKAFAREGDEAARFGGIGNKQAYNEVSKVNLEYTAFPLIYLFMFTGQILVTLFGGMMVINNEISFGTYMSFIAYLTMLYGPLEFMSWVSNWWARCVDAAQRVFEIIDSKPDVSEPENPIIMEDLNGDIDVSNVWFEYEPALPILKGMNLKAGAGKMLGIVGKTGAGKSTLANLIARLYDVGEGSITIGGVNVKRLPLAQLRQGIGVVSQDIYLFIGSIMDNIRYARPESTIEDVIRAAKAASAHDFIMNLPDGYETRVGAGGQDLSGGEKQRLSIARTIIQNPKILILDEATAAMDTETEGKIQEALATLQSGRTTIAIAHRLSTLRDADSLAVIADGRVTETGTHEELMRLGGEYRKLYNIQMEGLKIINMEAV